MLNEMHCIRRIVMGSILFAMMITLVTQAILIVALIYVRADIKKIEGTIYKNEMVDRKEVSAINAPPDMTLQECVESVIASEQEEQSVNNIGDAVDMNEEIIGQCKYCENLAFSYTDMGGKYSCIKTGKWAYGSTNRLIQACPYKT